VPFGSIFEGNPRVRTQKSISRTLDLSEFIIVHKPNKPAILFIQPNLEEKERGKKGRKCILKMECRKETRNSSSCKGCRDICCMTKVREKSACVRERERGRERERERVDSEAFQSIVKTTSVYVIRVHFPAGNQNRAGVEAKISSLFCY
jgi:hypothetical protein